MSEDILSGYVRSIPEHSPFSLSYKEKLVQMKVPQMICKRKMAVIGECMIEITGAPFEIQQQNFGGDTLNTAVYISRILPDLSLYYFTSLGVDGYSEKMISKWSEEGINCSLVLRDPIRLPGLYAIENNEEGERNFHYWRGDSAARYMCQHPTFIEEIEKLTDFDSIYLSGISIAILPESDKELLITCLEGLKKKGVKIIVDSNYRPVLWKSASHACQWINRMYSMSDLVLVTADDEMMMLNLLENDPKEIADRLHALGSNEVVIKLGSEGAFWSNTSGDMGIVAARKGVNVVDTTAAGDSFNAGYLAGMQLGMKMSECCRYGNLVAAEVIQHKGAIIPRSNTEHVMKSMSDNYDR